MKSFVSPQNNADCPDTRTDEAGFGCVLKPHEKVEDLQCDGLVIIQSSEEYRFTTDAVLLANFCRDMTGKFCVEFGSGCGVVAILVAYKKNPRRLVAMEIQPQLADMATRSVALNNMSDVVSVVCCDLKEAQNYIPQLADVVVCNPPYRKVGSGERQTSDNIAICRHEICATLADIVSSASKILNNRGNFYMVHQASRLCEIVTVCAEHDIAVKEIVPVCARLGKDPNLVLVRGVKNGRSDCILRAPLEVGN